MRFIPTRIHGVLDYLLGIVLIIAPWLFDFSDNDTAMWVSLIMGIALIIYSLLTDYELGVARAIPMPIHLVLDGLSGIVLIVSPWLFGFDDSVWVPHVVLGILEIGAAIFTETVPRYERRAEV